MSSTQIPCNWPGVIWLAHVTQAAFLSTFSTCNSPRPCGNNPSNCSHTHTTAPSGGAANAAAAVLLRAKTAKWITQNKERKGNGETEREREKGEKREWCVLKRVTSAHPLPLPCTHATGKCTPLPTPLRISPCSLSKRERERARVYKRRKHAENAYISSVYAAGARGRSAWRGVQGEGGSRGTVGR